MKSLRAFGLALLTPTLLFAADGGISVNADGSLQSISANEALAGCQAIYDTLVSPNRPEQGVLKTGADQCQALIAEAYQSLKRMDPEYMVGGISFSVGSHLNLFRGSIAKLSNDIRVEGFGGASLFLRVDPTTQGSGLHLSLAPLFGFALTPLQITLAQKRPLLVEPFNGLILFVGRNHPKRISDFNGWYGAAELQFPDPMNSDLMQRNAFGIRAMKHLTKDSYALFVYKSKNGGRDNNSLGLQTVYINNVDAKKSGEGITVDTLMEDLKIDTYQAATTGVDQTRLAAEGVKNSIKDSYNSFIERFQELIK